MSNIENEQNSDESLSVSSIEDESEFGEADSTYDGSSGAEPDGMYGNEPEYSAAELAALDDDVINFEDDSDSEAETSGLDSSRLDNLHWCSCRECSIMPTLNESKCCQEFGTLLGDKLSNDIKCITKHPHFDDICMKRHILEQSQLYLSLLRV